MSSALRLIPLLEGSVVDAEVGGGVRRFGLKMASFTIVRAHGDHFFSLQCSI